MFKIGDKVKYLGGTSTYTVMGQGGEDVKILHQKSLQTYYAKHYKLTLVEEEEVREEKEKVKLYEFEVDGVKLYGTKLAVNSAGQWVMEVRGSTAIYAVSPSVVEEVIPYSIGVAFLNNSKVYNYLAPKGKYQVGQVFLLEVAYGSAIVVVKDVDTKSPLATADFKPLAELVTKTVDK